MGKRRRIEITVYRSSVVRYDQPAEKTNKRQPLEGELSEQVSVRSTERVDQGDAKLTPADIQHPTELALLIDALVKNDGNSNRAARLPGLSRRNFISKLRGLGFPDKQ